MALLALLALAVCVPARAQESPRRLDKSVIVIDPGHGDRGVGTVKPDPGASADSLGGRAWECVFTWDTAMRVKGKAEKLGAFVFLTLDDPNGDYKPRAWGPKTFPSPGEGFEMKTLVEYPEPASEQDALRSRWETANRLWRRYHREREVYFLSLHFDSTQETLAGVSFYYAPRGADPHFVQAIEQTVREAGRERRDLETGAEHGLSQPHEYAVLTNAVNPAAALIELGNIQSRDEQGGNPDLWRMRNPATRDAYAQMLVDAMVRYADRPRGEHSGWLAGLLVAALCVAGWYSRRFRV
ncbi:MAG: hypothetical protein FJX76_08610 [Armatimonadetes bacterium]|nr:hypothetical protein [Armatimonadota bacterium]